MDLKELSDAYMRGDFDSDSENENEGQRLVVAIMNECHKSATRRSRKHGGTSYRRQRLDCSHLFDEVAEGHGPTVNYIVNNKQYDMGYYLTDGIYPRWATLVKSISHPQTLKLKYFVEQQEKVRKDVEKAFGILRARFAIIKGSARSWKLDFLGKIMKTCIILHNMIVEDERPSVEVMFRRPCRRNVEDEYESLPGMEAMNRLPGEFDAFLARHSQIRNNMRHEELKEDFIEHL